MTKQDFFREIAMTRHPMQNIDQEILPRNRPDVFLKKTDETIPDIYLNQDLSYEERIKKFKEDLKSLRLAYEPFLENHLPEQIQTKSVQPLKQFMFRYLEEGERFTHRERKDLIWENVTIPDYRGPAEEQGKWRAYYRCQFALEKKVAEEERVVIRFQCVDYKALIYINGNYIGEHEGFFAPFEFDITNYIDEDNELIIECQNDYTILGSGPVLDGDKIYAATGPGWDDPYSGWHHCPAGAGVFGKVTVEIRPSIYIEDIFVRPNIDEDCAEIRIGIINYANYVKENYDITVSMLPKNYMGPEIGHLDTKISYIGIGKNEYRYYIPLTHYKLWEHETPYLYGALVKVEKDHRIVSGKIGSFGIKKFISDENSMPKGRFYFNNRPFVLRGANEMGHLQQCVMNEDYNQLIDDILIAKLCNINYYRITQRPVQEEIYEYFDMLGMMQQCDFPLFSFLRRNKFGEAIKQVIEMEHLVRSHVSTIIVTFINEAVCIRRTENLEDKYSKRYEAKGHRHLLRDELEAFFASARKAIYIENPDRVIKNVEGDYDPPTAEGMPDFHCYTMWYSNHGEPIGRLMKGYLPPVKPGWMIGCGEYGAEGLDNEAIIQEYYPKEWLEADSKGNWYPDKIIRSQTYLAHGDWYREQKNISDWVHESQKHQAIATKLMTDAFRRRADVINHTAIHLLIDAWPSGWMKTLVDCKRIPKLAYFSYMDSLEKLRINIYTDRRYVYDNEQILVEAWLLNDTSISQNLTICVQLIDPASNIVTSWKGKGSVDEASSICAELISVTFPRVESKTSMRLVGAILNEEEEIINAESIELLVYHKEEKRREKKVCALGKEAEKLALNLGFKQEWGADTYICSDISENNLRKLELVVMEGGHGILFIPDENIECQIGNTLIETKGCGEVFFAATIEEYQEIPFTMLYNKEKDYIDFVGKRYISTNTMGESLVYTYGKKTSDTSIGEKPHLPFVKQIKMGKGKLTIISLLIKGRVCYNPNLDIFLRKLIEQ